MVYGGIQHCTVLVVLKRYGVDVRHPQVFEVNYLGLPLPRGKLRVRYALGLLKYQMIKPFSS